MTIEHALGSTTVPAEPARVVCLGWGSQDALWALGVQPVGVPEVTYGGLDDGTYPWWEGHFDAATTQFLPNPTSGEVPFEQIAALAPDLILAVYSGITAEDWSTLQEIAPTVAYPDQPWLTSWQDQATLVGRAVGRSEQAQALVADTEDDLAARAAEHPALAGQDDQLRLRRPGHPVRLPARRPAGGRAARVRAGRRPRRPRAGRAPRRRSTPRSPRNASATSTPTSSSGTA